jgi:hypothetical protein
VSLLDLLGLKKQIADVGGKYQSLLTEGERLRRQRDDLTAAPISRDDFYSAVCELIDSRAQQYPQRLLERVCDMGVDRSLADIHRMIADKDRRGTSLGLLAATQHTAATPHWKHLEEALYFLLNPELKAALRKAVDAMAWPAGAISLAERQKKLDDLNKKIGAIEKQQAELFTTAREMGIRLEA